MQFTEKQLKKLIEKSSYSQYVRTDNNGTEHYRNTLDISVLLKNINKKLKIVEG